MWIAYAGYFKMVHVRESTRAPATEFVQKVPVSG
eukprot:SAG31_NODE_35702_length_320_cov_1.393665_1_plen_33_part_10